MRADRNLAAGLRRWLPFAPVDGFIGVVGLYMLLRPLTGGAWWPVALAADFLHLWLLLVFPLLALMLLLRRWRRAALLGVGAGLWLVLFGGLFLPRSEPPSCAECTALRVMTYNVGAGRAAPEALVETLRTVGADIVGLQEVSPAQGDALQTHLQAAYPHQAVYPYGDDGRALLSKHPIQSADYVDANWEHLPPYLLATVAVEGQPVTVIVYRAHPPRLGPYPRRGFGYHTWRSGAELVNAVGVDGPTILLADLNTTDQSADYHAVRRAGYVDAHRAAGWGYGATFPTAARSLGPLAGMPLLRLDMIWLAGDVTPVSGWRLIGATSDHLPYVVEVQLAGAVNDS